jgi:hypothetical protein
MKELILALKAFENRNNITTIVIVNSDSSFGLEEFWAQDDLGSFDTYDELLKFLTETQYALDESGVCIRPCTITNPHTATDTVKES